MKLLREPLLHFIFIGAAIYLLYGIFAEPAQEETENTIVVSAGEIQWMQSSWQKRWNRPPTDKELDGMVQQYIKETVLYREALTMGLNKHDTVIRRRLAQKLEFLAKDLVALTPPSDKELQNYFEQHKSRYQAPARFTFTQVFIDPDKRGDKTLDDAETIKASLIAKNKNASDVSTNINSLGDNSLGDKSMLENYYPEKDPTEIQKLFGSGFAESLVKLSSGQWHGPVLSGYGVHLVNIQQIIQPPPPVFAEKREHVIQDWKTDKGNELNKKFYDNLRKSYNIVIEEPKQTNKQKDNKVAALQEQTQ